MKLVILIGHRGSGKDTLTNELLKQTTLDYKVLQLPMLRKSRSFSFADRLKSICGTMAYNGRTSMFEDAHKSEKYSGNVEVFKDMTNRDILRVVAKMIKDNFGADYFAKEAIAPIMEFHQMCQETEEDNLFIVRDLRFFKELLVLNEICNNLQIVPLFVHIIREEARVEVENYEGDFDVNNIAKYIKGLPCQTITTYNRGDKFEAIKKGAEYIIEKLYAKNQV